MTVMVDDYLPILKGDEGKDQTIYASLEGGSPLWAPILEKAFAKRYGNYEHITSGKPSEAVRALTGTPYKEYLHGTLTVEVLWQLVSSRDKFDDFIMVGTENAGPGDDAVGANKEYSYTVLGTHVLSTDGSRLIKIRNPWGTAGFRGTMTDKDPRWTAEAKKEVGYQEGNDGIFWLDINNYKSHFSETWISFKTDDWATAKFLKKNDESK
jgi:calpain-15